MNSWVQCRGCGLRHSVRADLHCPRCHAPDPGAEAEQPAPSVAPAIAAGPAGLPAAAAPPAVAPAPKAG